MFALRSPYLERQSGVRSGRARAGHQSPQKSFTALVLAPGLNSEAALKAVGFAMELGPDLRNRFGDLS